jgi:hypothetical protein
MVKCTVMDVVRSSMMLHIYADLQAFIIRNQYCSTEIIPGYDVLFKIQDFVET